MSQWHRSSGWQSVALHRCERLAPVPPCSGLPGSSVRAVANARPRTRPQRFRHSALGRGGIYVDPRDPERYVETFVVGSWDEHLRQHERMTLADQSMEERVRAFHTGEGPPIATHLIYATETWVKEVQQSQSEHAMDGGVYEHHVHDT